jgi:hypothetical protein
MITSFGDSGLPVAHAGHWLWHRPHSVQVAKSSIAVHLKSSTLPTRKCRPRGSSSGFPPDITGSSGPSPSGRALSPDERQNVQVGDTTSTRNR